MVGESLQTQSKAQQSLTQELNGANAEWARGAWVMEDTTHYVGSIWGLEG
jgi:hypothetical protein